MFIKNTRGYYGTDGTQHSGRASYLALFSWNPFKAQDEVRDHCEYCQHRKTFLHTARMIAPTVYYSSADMFNAYESCTLHREVSARGPVYANGRPMLWAMVRKCALTQLGHFMMGSINIGGKRITVSGPCGSDGLPLDYQEVACKDRMRLVEVPEDVAEVYWNDNGHNDIGRARDTLRTWALNAFAKEVR